MNQRMKNLTPRQRRFVQNYLRSSNATRAYIEAGYSRNQADSGAGRLLRTSRIKQALERAHALADGQALLSIVERKEMLSRLATQIANHDPADFVETGPDGNVSIRIDKTTPNRLAIAGLKSRTERGPDGEQAIVTDLKLRDPTIAIKAIDALNKMDGLYRDNEGSGGVSVQFVIQGPSGEPKQVFSVQPQSIEAGYEDAPTIEIPNRDD